MKKKLIFYYGLFNNSEIENIEKEIQENPEFPNWTYIIIKNIEDRDQLSILNDEIILLYTAENTLYFVEEEEVES